MSYRWKDKTLPKKIIANMQESAYIYYYNQNLPKKLKIFEFTPMKLENEILKKSKSNFLENYIIFLIKIIKNIKKTEELSNWQSTLKDIVFDKSKLHSIRYNPYVRNHSLKDFFDFCPYDKLKIIKNLCNWSLRNNMAIKGLNNKRSVTLLNLTSKFLLGAENQDNNYQYFYTNSPRLYSYNVKTKKWKSLSTTMDEFNNFVKNLDDSKFNRLLKRALSLVVIPQMKFDENENINNAKLSNKASNEKENNYNENNFKKRSQSAKRKRVEDTSEEANQNTSNQKKISKRKTVDNSTKKNQNNNSKIIDIVSKNNQNTNNQSKSVKRKRIENSSRKNNENNSTKSKKSDSTTNKGKNQSNNRIEKTIKNNDKKKDVEKSNSNKSINDENIIDNSKNENSIENHEKNETNNILESVDDNSDKIHLIHINISQDIEINKKSLSNNIKKFICKIGESEIVESSSIVPVKNVNLNKLDQNECNENQDEMSDHQNETINKNDDNDDDDDDVIVIEDSDNEEENTNSNDITNENDDNDDNDDDDDDDDDDDSNNDKNKNKNVNDEIIVINSDSENDSDIDNENEDVVISYKRNGKNKKLEKEEDIYDKVDELLRYNFHKIYRQIKSKIQENQDINKHFKISQNINLSYTNS